MYARSLFGEDALANLSIERVPHAETGEIQVTGYVRIRSKTQGIALSLGDKITLGKPDRVKHLPMLTFATAQKDVPVAVAQ